MELVTLALFALDGHKHLVDTEDVAMKVHELAPGRFAWKKYPDQINLELVRVYLSAAKDPSRGAWVDGTGRSGWTLTTAGLEWANTNAVNLLNRDLERDRHERRGGSIDERRWQRERVRLLGTVAWDRWLRGQADEITPREAAAVFRIDTYAVGRTRDLKINRLTELFENDHEIKTFLSAVIPLISEKEGLD